MSTCNRVFILREKGRERDREEEEKRISKCIWNRKTHTNKHTQREKTTRTQRCVASAYQRQSQENERVKAQLPTFASLHVIHFSDGSSFLFVLLFLSPLYHNECCRRKLFQKNKQKKKKNKRERKEKQKKHKKNNV